MTEKDSYYRKTHLKQLSSIFGIKPEEHKTLLDVVTGSHKIAPYRRTIRSWGNDRVIMSRSKGFNYFYDGVTVFGFEASTHVSGLSVVTMAMLPQGSGDTIIVQCAGYMQDQVTERINFKVFSPGQDAIRSPCAYFDLTQNTVNASDDFGKSRHGLENVSKIELTNTATGTKVFGFELGEKSLAFRSKNSIGKTKNIVLPHQFNISL